MIIHVIPSGDGPTVLVSRYLLENSEVRALMQILEGRVADDAARPAAGEPDADDGGPG